MNGYTYVLQKEKYMEIKKINENQIRCMLTKEDLSERDLNVSELAYDSDKARDLFSELLVTASNDLDFDTDGIPIVIEAVPMSHGSLMLLVTKSIRPTECLNFDSIKLSNTDDDGVSDAFDIDNNFETLNLNNDVPDDFSEDDTVSDDSDDEALSSDAQDSDSDDVTAPDPRLVADIFNAFTAIQKLIGNRAIAEKKEKAEKKEAATESQTVTQPKPVITSMCFAFNSVTEIHNLAKILLPLYSGRNTLYKSYTDGKYFLVLKKGNYDDTKFSTVCHICSEYGTYVRMRYASVAFFDEHFKVIFKDDALQMLTFQDKH